MKNKHKNIASLTCYFIPVAISIVLTLPSCSSFCKVKHNKIEVVQDTHEQEGFLKATVKNYIDGCAFMLHLTNGKKLEPVNLPEEFKKENINVWIKYAPYKGSSSICMAGEMVTIIKIEKDISSGKVNIK